MKKTFILIFSIVLTFGFKENEKRSKSNPPIYIAFLWHMHQPIYWPYETILQTEANNRYSYSVVGIHNQRVGPYTSWPKNAVMMGINANLQHFGAQVSFSGSLIENLNNLETGGNQNFQNWKSHWNYIKTQTTSLGNPRLDMVAFGYHHPLMGLIDDIDIRKQIQYHKLMFSQNFSGNYSKGVFPPENAFSTRMIKPLVEEGIKWVLVDNIHFERACDGYPFSTTGNIYEPNKSDVRNPNPGDWIQLNGLWAPTKVSARWARQPHFVEYIDPNTGEKSKIIAVPADRYLGNEDGRGGFGALNYEGVMSQLENYNTDPAHPILIVLAHDGDNYGGGSESYYNNNFQNFVNWLLANPTRFVCTTIEDYLQMFPPDSNDVIHVEPGSWSGADNGDPEFKKWLGDPDASGYSPDRNSWAVVTAAKNFVYTAHQIDPVNANTQNAWKYLLNAQSSDYWYWDGAQDGVWDSHPTRACNQAVTYSQNVIGSGTDLTPPTIFLPQREPYNPGGTEWGILQSSNFKIWTYVFDISGLKSVKLKYRLDLDGSNSWNTTDNETYVGGSEVTDWIEISMNSLIIPSQTDPQPYFKPKEFFAEINGLSNVLIDYFVEAIDSNNNLARSPIQHVWVGLNNGGGAYSVSWLPLLPSNQDTILISVTNVFQAAKLHWGVNNWQTPNSIYWPEGSYLYNGVGPAIESPFEGPDSQNNIRIKIGPFNKPIQTVTKMSFVIHYADNSWDNNNGADYQIRIGLSGGGNFVMDGLIDSTAQLMSENNGLSLYLGWNGADLYLATQSAQSQNADIFIFVSDSQRSLINSPWAKAGKVAGWSAYLGNESSNNWCGWFDNSGAAQKYASASYLEGTLNLLSEFGYVPGRVFVSIGKYQTQDGGSLINQVPAGNGDLNIDSSEFFIYNLNQVPGVPNLIHPSGEILDSNNTITFTWYSVINADEYIIQISEYNNFLIMIIDDTVANNFFASSELNFNKKYYWRVKAINKFGESNFSEVKSFTLLKLIKPDVNISPGWNLISVPVKSINMLKNYLFPTSISNAYCFDNGYRKADTLKNGMGYWLKFNIAEIISFNGAEIYSDSIKVNAGWNLIGSISHDCIVNLISTEPENIIVSEFYEYANGYIKSDTLKSGKAYWVKVSQGGKVILK